MCSFQGIGYSASLITNGVLLNEPTCKKLKQAQVRAVRVTLDGPREYHDAMRPAKNGKGSYDQVLQAVKTASAYLDVGIGINVEPA